MDAKHQHHVVASEEEKKSEVEHEFRVSVNVNGKHFSIPCGQGRQTVRWLALVASQRYVQSQQPHGWKRQREKGESKTGMYLPTSVSIEGETISPFTTLYELAQRYHSSEQPAIEIILAEKPNVLSEEVPRSSIWAGQAFNFSDQGKRVVKTREEEDEAARSSHTQAARSERMKIQAKHLSEIHSVLEDLNLAVSKPSEEDLQRVDWEAIGLHNIEADDEAQIQFERIMVDYYATVREIFEYFSGEAFGRNLYPKLYWPEMKHMANRLQLLDHPKEEKLLIAAFKASSGIEGDGKTEPEESAAITLFDLLRVLLRMAISRWRLEKRGDSSSTAGEILASYLETYLVPFAVSASSGTTRAAMHSEVVYSFFAFNLQRLQRMFLRETRGEVLMYVETFSDIARLANLIPSDRKESVTTKCQSQTGGEEIQRINFREFIESLAHASVEVHNDVPPVDAIISSLKELLNLQTLSARKESKSPEEDVH